MDASSKKPWKCNFPNCHQAFKSEERLKKHKASDCSHDYCHYCDEGFEDWDALTAHKAAKAANEIQDIKKWEKRELHREMMEANGVQRHVIERQREQDPKPKIRHLCCKFCGMEFGSLAGRDAHINQLHQIDQEIPCPGCDLVFSRASALIRHFEQNECPRITRNRFAGYIQHKAIVNRLLANPELISELENNDFLEAAVDTDEGGGVMLGALDRSNDSMDLGPTLEPQRPNANRHIPVQQQAWPELAASNPRSTSVEVINGIKNLSISSMAAKVPDSKPIKVESDPLPGLEDLPAYTEPTASTSSAQPAWSSGSASSKLFPAAQPSPTPLATPWQSAVDSKAAPDHRHNILQHQFWNPARPDFNAARFYNPIVESYRCPIPGCATGVPTPADLEAHIASAHAAPRPRCPACHREFATRAALVAHVESAGAGGGRCRLPASGRLGVLVDGLSGGLLSAARVARPDYDVGRDGSRVAYLRFESGAREDLRVEREAENRARMVTGGVDMRGTLGVRVGERVDDRSQEEVEADAKVKMEFDWF